MLQIVQMALGAGVDHENTTDEGSVARKIFAPNELTAGKVFTFEGVINVLDTNSTDTLTIAVRFGTSTTASGNTAVGTSAAVDAADADICVVRGTIHCQTGRIVISLMMSDPDAEGIAVKAYTQVISIEEDTTYYLDITGDWLVAHADNEVYAEAFYVAEAA